MMSEENIDTRKFKHLDFKMISPQFGSSLTDLIIDLEQLREKRLRGTTPIHIFFQIKNIFHMLESIDSARIEGNRTTIAEYVDRKIEREKDDSEEFKEIENMEKALAYIDGGVNNIKIDRAFLSDLHKMLVDGLTKEGSKWPGQWRNIEVKIGKSSHVPPPRYLVEKYMDELFKFINQENAKKFDLLKTALAHHRFVWVHPFDNGDGRTVRLLTYSMLVMQGFNVHISRVLNPAAIFASNRNNYYHHLSLADSGEEEGILKWVYYMLSGLKSEIEKTDMLTDYGYLRGKILLPAINFSLEKNIVNQLEANILKLAINKEKIENSDIRKEILPMKHIAQISTIIKKLLDANMLIPVEGKKRIYTINFEENKLLRGIINSLYTNGFTRNIS